MGVWSAFALALVLTAVPPSVGACSSDPDELEDPDLPVVTANPDGVPYPADHIGGRERAATRPGDRMPNFTFRAYRAGRAGGLETVSMAEYFDPDQRRHKVLHVQLAATWCAVCSAELSATVPVTERLKEEGIVFLEIVVSGASAGIGPSFEEIDSWVDRHQTNFPTAIDVRARRLGPLGVSGSVMPHDILVDTRTMENPSTPLSAPPSTSRSTPGTA